MYPHEPLRICTQCRIPHYENCPNCFGWGRYRSGNDGQPYPVNAAEAHGDAPTPPNLEPCPTCGSTIIGRAVEKLVRSAVESLIPKKES